MKVKVPDSITAVLRRLLGCCGWKCSCLSWHKRGQECDVCGHVLATREHERDRDALRARISLLSKPSRIHTSSFPLPKDQKWEDELIDRFGTDEDRK